MPEKTIGNTDIRVSQIGLGCMGLSEFYGPSTDIAEAVKLLHEAIELGVNHFDTAESYGIGSANETLLGKAFHDRRDKVKIATKFGPVRDPETGARIGLDGSAENCRRAVEGSLQRLQTDYIDLYYLHRADPNTPIEVTVTAMAKLVEEGKIGAVGLSEVSADTLRRANKIHHIAALQSEYSIFSRDIEAEIIPACNESGTSLVAYSPLGRGMLTGTFKAESELGDKDFRGVMQPRFSGDAFAVNLALVEQIASMASGKGVKPAEIALAWVMARHENVLPVAGTTRLENLKTNIDAMDLCLDIEDMAALDKLADQVSGTRYNAQGMQYLNG